MANIDLSSQEWCDLIFEGRNKAYGAYEMRSSSPKRHNLATLIVVVVALLAFTLPKLVRNMMPEKDMDMEMTEVTTLSNLKEAEVKKNEELKPLTQAPPPPPLKSSIKFTAPVIKKDEEVSDEEEIKSQEELTESKVTISIADVKGNDEEHGQDIADFKEAIKPVVEEDNKVWEIVEQKPQFPGGEAALMKYIRDNMQYPSIAQENGIQGRVVVRFVVSKDGSVRDVTVMRGVDPSLDKEAIRVVKSLPNFIPGKQNGHAVNVYYILPVSFRLM
ncbi:MAG: energy transducer TonB [Bacteroidetes bacterium]|uniref:Energy transducer TonB n=1 Tax=Candidatus Caccoplasma merdipullorum TaxID=2840718 RepID=A0A9D9H8A7_9BACT|nr:energy transducer TonB [Candidatus Caccoplasma merdipullorum]